MGELRGADHIALKERSIKKLEILKKSKPMTHLSQTTKSPSQGAERDRIDLSYARNLQE
jgi:hypothetical protein